MTRLNVAFLRALDTNADPVSGGKLYTYAAGTTTPVTTYSDSDLTTAQAHPVPANSVGEFPEVYVPDGDYKVVVKDAEDLTLYEADAMSFFSPGRADGVSFGTIADAVSNTKLKQGQWIFIAGRQFKTVPASTYTANGDTVVDLTGSGLQAVLSARETLNNTAAVLADTRPPGWFDLDDDGSILWTREGDRYKPVSASGPKTVQNAGGAYFEVQEAPDGVDPCDFGFVGDGSQADTAILQRVADSLGAYSAGLRKQWLVIPNGTYELYEEVQFKGLNVHMAPSAVLKPRAGFAGDVFIRITNSARNQSWIGGEIDGGGQAITLIKAEDFDYEFDGLYAHDGGIGIQTDSFGIHIHHCDIRKNSQYGVFGGDAKSPFTANTIEYNSLSQNGTNLRIVAGGTNSRVENNIIQFPDVRCTEVLVQAGTNSHFVFTYTGNYHESAVANETMVHFDNTDAVAITGLAIENNAFLGNGGTDGQTGLYVNASNKKYILRNNFSNFEYAFVSGDGNGGEIIGNYFSNVPSGQEITGSGVARYTYGQNQGLAALDGGAVSITGGESSVEVPYNLFTEAGDISVTKIGDSTESGQGWWIDDNLTTATSFTIKRAGSTGIDTYKWRATPWRGY